VNVFRFVPGYDSYIYDEGKEPLFALFLSFLIAFALTRGYTRLARRRGWGSGNVGGIHLHHVVPGIVLVLVGGLMSFTTYADNEIVEGIVAIFFGAGAALVLDEFALIFHLKDVYWTTEGRSSVDATIIGVMIAGLLLVSSSPFQEDGDVESGDPKSVVFSTIAVTLIFAAITLLKGKIFTGIAGVFLAPIALVGAIRLAKPYSPWAHHRYDPERARNSRSRRRRARKLERAWRRYENGWGGRFENWLIDLIGGTPHLRSDGESRPAAEQAHSRAGVSE
jgi:lysyl-tRNA synthetase, class II